MIKYLEESTNNVKSRRKFSKMMQIIVYLVIWSMSIIVFWIGGRLDAMGYSLAVFYLVLPITTFVISIFMGKDNSWANYKWLMLLFFGVMYMLALYATFSLANAIAFDKNNLPKVADMLPGILCSAAGLLTGTIINAIKTKKSH
ncbi:hypothetical protein [Paratissierella segnis]|jgi:hypothetical protein|uniref:Uncharacterized protein n=1 Tax=Paratissierella segnis TaxID=2763679 RepID=A0A926ET62_9FIRM|nr:hypothetical protein [Paratissierella segnis]MBC8587768.1 hypothetical protein [Paratissierella segnis]